MRTRALLLALSLSLSLSLAALAGCVDPDLGDAPVYCNLYEPRCPEGYACRRQGAYEVCLREGTQPPAGADGGVGVDGVSTP